MPRKLHVTFFMEQHAGHRTYSLNLQTQIAQLDGLDAHWVNVDYREPITRLFGTSRLAPLAAAWAGRAQVLRGLRSRTLDIAFFFTQVPAALARNSLRRIPYVVSTDITPVQYDHIGGPYGHDADKKGSLIGRYKQATNRAMFHNAAKAVAWSKWVASSLRHDYGLADSAIEVVYPGVDGAFWRPGKESSATRPRILFVGNDFKRKGGGLLLEAFRQLPEGSAELAIATPEALPPEPFITTYRNLTPNSAALVALYQSAAIFVLPSRADASPHVVLEAGACGLPVITSRVGSLSEMVIDGQTGLLVDSENVVELKDALRRLLDNNTLRKEMGAANRHWITSHFSARNNAERIAQILQEEMGKRHIVR